jgi:hypothetical protein
MRSHSQAYYSMYRPSLASQTAPTVAFSSFRINTQREGLGDCLYRFGSQKCEMYVTSRVGSAHTMSRAGQVTLLFSGLTS